MFDSVFTECNKCNGQGKIDAYYYVSNGVCFKCGGSGKIHKLTNKPADILTDFQIECINNAKKQIKDLGYFEMTDVLSDMDFEQLTDILNQHKASLEVKDNNAGFADEQEWLELMGLI